MGAVLFYHLTRQPLEAVLPMLLEKSLGAGWRVVVRGRSPERMGWLDEKLWLLGDESFLPHGQAGQPHENDQPILLTTTSETPNGAACLMSVDGADVAADEVNSLERTCILFDGNDDSAVQQARSQWRSLTEAGCSAQYWSQESGSWKKQAES